MLTEFPAGTLVYRQGEASPHFFILRSGKVEIVRVPGKREVTDEEIAAHGRSLAVFDAPGTPLGEMSAFRGEPRRASLRTTTEAVLLRVPADDSGVAEWARRDPAAARDVVHGLVRLVMEYVDRPRLAGEIEREAARLHANLAVAHLLLGGRDDALARRGARVAKALRAAGRPIPSRPSVALLEGDPTSALGAAPAASTWTDAGFFRFLDRFLAGPPEAWEHVAADSSVVWLLRRAAAGPSAAKAEALRLGRRAEEAVLDLLREAVEPFVVRARRGEAVEFARRLAAGLKRLAADGAEIWGDDLPGLAGAIALLESSIPAPPPAPRAASAPAVRADRPLRVLEAVLALAPGAAFREAFPRAIAGGLAHDEQAAKDAARLYWDLYPAVWKAHRAEPRPEYLLFLRYGIASSDPIAPAAAEAAFALDGTPSVPIYHADEWLDRIHDGEFPPSRNEFDRTYAEIAAERGGRYAEGEEDPAMDLVRYEIDEVLRVAARMMSGGRGLPMPVLAGREAAEFLGRRDRPRRVTIAEALAPVLEVDFSAFFREVRVSVDGKPEFVQKDVFPRFVIVPAAGDRAVPWQEFEGRAKETPGRLLFPSVAAAPPGEMMLEAVARYRWELSRAAAGHEWADPVHGGLSGKYFDYLSTYKKLQEIPPEAKADLAKIWASARTDADRFAAEYRVWVRQESQGVQKLNKVSRRILAEFVPFARPVRERLLSHPVFGDLLRKDSNRRLQKLKAIEIKEKALQKAGIETEGLFDDAKRLFEPLPETAE